MLSANHPLPFPCVHGQMLAELFGGPLFQMIDETIEVDQPSLVFFFEKEEIEPGDDMMDPFKKRFHLLIELELRMEEPEEVEILHSL